MRSIRTFPVPPRRLAAGLLVAGLVAACDGGGQGEAEAASDSAVDAAGAFTDDSAAPGSPALLGVISGLRTPESVLHDAEQDVYFVANIDGSPAARDGNGFIARVHADSLDSPKLDFVRGGRTGITLNAPKGMAIQGDTIWVADVDALRAFNRRTGRPHGSVDLRGVGAVFLNDVAVGPDGALYVTDTGLRFTPQGTTDASAPAPSRIYRVSGRVPAVAVEGEILSGPNGIVWDSAGRRFLIAPFNGPTILAWSPDSAARAPNPRRLAAGPGSYDGIAILPDGGVLVSSWADSSLYLMRDDTTLTQLITGVETPAALDVDPKRNLVLIPLLNQNRVVVYGLP
ncbi:MAG TPA: SMP-30/gluconolactonase/LRE family protein [Gemmatimonadales bacterium]